MQERHAVTIQRRGDEVRRYESRERRGFVVGEDIIGLDANALVDLVESEEFNQNIREQVNLGVLGIYTTNVALGEARRVLKRDRGYSHEKATESLQGISKEFGIVKIDHNEEGNKLGNQWVDKVKKQMHIKKFHTFPNDCRIIANLYKQVGVNLFMTEDQDIEKAVDILKIPVRVRILPEASHLDDFEIKRYFKERRKDFRKFQKRR